MKKLNRKGFTLIELLAVIVVLAIVLVVTIPSVISSMNSAKQKSLQNAADSIQEWFQKNYEIANIGGDVGTPDIAYSNFMNGKTFTKDTPIALDSDVVVAAGISNAGDNLNFSDDKGVDTYSTVYLDGTTNKLCVTLVAKSGGNFYNTASDAETTLSSSGCTNKATITPPTP